MRRQWVFPVTLGLLFTAGVVLAVIKAPGVLAEYRLARVRADWHMLWEACRAYGLDNCGINFPADTSLRRQRDPSAPQTFEEDRQFMAQALGDSGPCLLTTPIAYTKTIPRDPFRANGEYYSYAAIRAGTKPGSISPFAFLHSPGPDGRTDLEPAQLRAQIDEILHDRSNWRLTPHERAALRRMIDPVLYDPTNGVSSGGDIVLLMDAHHYHYGFCWEPDSAEWSAELKELLSVKVEADDPLKLPIEQRLSRECILEVRRDLRITVPRELVAALSQAGVVDSEGDQLRMNHSRHEQLCGHLGPFAGFFESPRALTASEKDSLARWRREDPAWWGIMAGGGSSAAEAAATMSVYDLYPLLALYGKSRLLQAASAIQTAPQETRRHIDQLRAWLGQIQSSWGREPTVYMERVHQELGRLCDCLK